MKQKNDPIMGKQIKEIIENLQKTNDGTHFDFIIPGYASNKSKKLHHDET